MKFENGFQISSIRFDVFPISFELHFVHFECIYYDKFLAGIVQKIAHFSLNSFIFLIINQENETFFW